jgi:hypothetical protein
LSVTDYREFNCGKLNLDDVFYATAQGCNPFSGILGQLHVFYTEICNNLKKNHWKEVDYCQAIFNSAISVIDTASKWLDISKGRRYYWCTKA